MTASASSDYKQTTAYGPQQRKQYCDYLQEQRAVQRSLLCFNAVVVALIVAAILNTF
jgi:hypothetical protein